MKSESEDNSIQIPPYEVFLDGVDEQSSEELLLISDLCVEGVGLPQDSKVNIIFTTDENISKLNTEFFGIGGPTDCIAFPYEPGEFVDENKRNLIGDVFISVDTAKIQAEELGHSLTEELATLIVHSILHLIGYNDDTEEDRIKMEKKTDFIVEKVMSKYMEEESD
ncbi:MAG: rRNA maturation RNase YbeY [bacterium]